MAEEPVMSQRSPYFIQEEPGTKMWCACGRSENQPYCDGTHSGTGITPVKAEIAEAKGIAWCGCRQTKNAPYCDGSHKNLP